MGEVRKRRGSIAAVRALGLARRPKQQVWRLT